MVTGGYNGLQRVIKRLQRVTRGYRGLQGVKGDNKGFQGVTEGYKGLQRVTRVTGVYSGSQEVTGG